MSMTPNDSSSPSNETNSDPARPYDLLRAEPVSLQTLANLLRAPEWRATEALLGLERQKHLECLANPQFNDRWGAHRAIANWILEFTTTMCDNLLALAKEQRQPTSPPVDKKPGTDYMEHTADFDNEDLAAPARAVEAN